MANPEFAGTIADMTSVLADTAIIKGDTTTIKADTATIKADTGTIKSDTSTIKADTGTIKSDTSTIKADTTTIKSDTATIKDNTQYVGAIAKPSNVAKFTHATEYSVAANAGERKYMRAVTVGVNGKVRVKLDGKCSSGTNATVEFYVDGVKVTPNPSSSLSVTSTYATMYADIPVMAGSSIEVVYFFSGGVTVYIKNFIIAYDLSTPLVLLY